MYHGSCNGSIFHLICRWIASKKKSIPPAFHRAFHRKLEQITEQDRIQRQWQSIWNAGNMHTTNSAANLPTIFPTHSMKRGDDTP